MLRNASWVMALPCVKFVGFPSTLRAFIHAVKPTKNVCSLQSTLANATASPAALPHRRRRVHRRLEILLGMGALKHRTPANGRLDCAPRCRVRRQPGGNRPLGNVFYRVFGSIGCTKIRDYLYLVDFLQSHTSTDIERIRRFLANRGPLSFSFANVGSLTIFGKKGDHCQRPWQIGATRRFLTKTCINRVR